MPDPEPGILRRPPQPDTQRQPRHPLAPGPKPLCVGRPRMGRGHRPGPHRRVRQVQPHRPAGGPDAKGRPDRRRQHLVPPPDIPDPLRPDHVKRDPQAVKVMRRCRPVEVMPVFLRVRPRPPVPVTRDAARPFPRPVGAVVEEDKAHPRRHHQPLLAGRHHHVDAPGVHLEPVAAQRRDAVRHQKRGMPHPVQRRPQPRHVVPDRRGRVHMHRQHRADAALRVGSQPLLDPPQIPGPVRPEVDDLDLRPQPARHLAPAMPEPPRRRDKHKVAPRQHIRQRRLPGRMAIADIDHRLMRRPRHRAQVGDQPRRHLDQFALIDVGRCPVHRRQHRIRHDRGSGNGKIGTTLGQHEGFFR